MLPTEFSVDEEQLEPILVEKDLVQCDVQVNTSKQDFHLSKDIGRSIVKRKPYSLNVPISVLKSYKLFPAH